MRKASNRPWNLELDASYQPNVSMIIPTYNEVAVIEKKLKNLEQLIYPNHKLQIIIVDSNSTDSTVSTIKKYLNEETFPFEILVLEEDERKGKSSALNYALNFARYKIIATSDADSFWEPNSLQKAVYYLSDPSVGALTGRETFVNESQNIVTRSESMYRDIYYVMRYGESKIHSTSIFQGEFSIYKLWVFHKFNEEKGSDDCGTVKRIISNGYRTIFVPELIFSDYAQQSIMDRIKLKRRRAVHLIDALISSFYLKYQNKFPQPSLILFMNLFIHVINPFLFIPFSFGMLLLMYNYLQLFYLLLPLVLLKKFRIFMISYVTGNVSLILAFFDYVLGNQRVVWEKIGI